MSNRAICSSRSPATRPTVWALSPRRSKLARRRSWRSARHWRRFLLALPLPVSRMSAWRWRWRRRNFIRASRKLSRGHRHQRQDVRCRIHPADLECARIFCSEHRHRRHRFAKRRNLRIADHARSGRAASLHRYACRGRRDASRDRSVIARARSVPARRLAYRRRRLHQHHPRSPRLSSELRCLSRGQAAAVR